MIIKQKMQLLLNTDKKNEWSYSIGFYRFIFTILIISMHLNEQFQQKLFSQVNKPFCGGAYIGVDFFFILSGFLLYLNFDRHNNNNENAWNYAWHKIKGFYIPYILAFILLLTSICIKQSMSFKQTIDFIYSLKWEVLMLQMSGLGEAKYINYPTWYISVMIILALLVYALLQNNKKFFVDFIAPVVVVFCGGYYAYTYGTIAIWNDYNGFLSAAMMRGAIGICLGVIACQLYFNLKEKKFGKITLFFLNIAEVCSIYIVCLKIKKGADREDFFVILILALLIILSFLNVTIISRLLNSRLVNMLGKLSLFIYLNQAFVQTIILHYVKPNSMFSVALGAQIIFSIILAIILDYIIKIVTILFKEGK